MVIDITDVMPLFTWLLGPGWTEGLLFQPLVLAIVILLICGGLFWACRRMRKGDGSTSPGTGLALSIASLALILLILIGTAVLKSAPGKDAAAPFAGLAWLQGLLGAEWHQGALYHWLAAVVCGAAAVYGIAWIFTAIRRGPKLALETTGQAIGDCLLDVARLSPRRVAALAWLAVKESIRRRVVVVFAVFVLLLLFAGWFLDPGSPDPARLYLDFVLTWPSFLLILLVLFLSSMSLPVDIKSRTLHTIVTKPVRASEIVLGRIAGFTAVATFLLLVMALISYVFVARGLDHTHAISAGDLKPLDAAADVPTGFQGRTSEEFKHRHNVIVGQDGSGRVNIEKGHYHELQGDWKELLAKESGGKQFQLGPPRGQLMARVPVYGKIAFRDPLGEPTDKGINVGDEWTYRSYIQGGSLASAIWTFQGVTKERFPNGLPVELMLGVFRTHKGDMAKGVPGSLLVRNPGAPEDVKPVEVRIFESKEFQIDTQTIPLEFQTPEGKKDLFKDFVSDGKIEIWLRCAAPGQYFGVAQADMYLRARNASFAWNFAQGYIGIWLLTLVVISFGVLFSTFLSAPVALLATAGAMFGGLFHDFMYRLAMHQTYGGGPFESFLRILTQDNVTSELQPGLRATVVQTLDQPAELGLWLIASVLPDLSRYQVFANCVASGFHIPGDTILAYACRTFAFVLPLFVAAYLCMKNREVAQQ